MKKHDLWELLKTELFVFISYIYMLFMLCYAICFCFIYCIVIVLRLIYFKILYVMLFNYCNNVYSQTVPQQLNT